MGRRTIRDPDGHSWSVRRRWTLSALPAGPDAAGGLKTWLRNRRRRGRSEAKATAESPTGDVAGGVLEVFDEVGLIIAILAAVVLAVLLLTAFFVALLIELVLAMVLLIVGVVWRVILRRPWTVEAVRQPAAEGDLETIVVEPVVLGDQSVGDRSGMPGVPGDPAGAATAGNKAPPIDVHELPAPDVVSMPDQPGTSAAGAAGTSGTASAEPRSVPLRLAWRVVGWRASGALRRSVADHLRAFGPSRFVGDQ